LLKKIRLKLLSTAVCVFILLNYTIVGQAATILDSYSKQISIGLTSLNNISTLNFTITENYYIQETGRVLNKSSKYNVSLSNSVFNVYQDGNLIASLDKLTISPYTNTSFISFKKDSYVRYFSGSIYFNKQDSSTFVPVNKLNIEDYLKGVVPYESGESYPIEALKAQAVAARTYALANLGRYSASGFDLTDDTRCQVYRGYSSNFPKSNQAVDATKGQVLTYNGNLICAYFSASNGGYTEDSGNVWSSSLPYLVSKPDSFDSYTWKKTFTMGDLDAALKSKAYITVLDKFTNIDLNNIKTYQSGRISNIGINYTDVAGVQKTIAISKDSARTFLSLPSAMYTVSFDSTTNQYTFNGKGNGHGIGMSQMGSQNRAQSGQTYTDILKFYYDNTTIKYLVSDTTPTTPTVQTGWVSKDGKTYFMDSKGVPVLNKWMLNAQGSWAYLGADGAMATNKWVQDSSTRWFYLGSDGAMVTNKWVLDSNKWFYMGADGAMATNKWAQDSSKRWFYLGTDGAMMTKCWTLYKGIWYYLGPDGAMKTNTTVDGYKINSWGGSNKPVTNN